MAYRLDLKTLLLMLNQSTGTLQANLQHMPRGKEYRMVFLRLERGTITTSSIRDRHGNEVLTGEAAIKLVQNQVLEWDFTEQQAPSQTSNNTSSRLPIPALPSPASRDSSSLATSSTSPIPHRVYPISQHDFLSWPRLYRAVYALIDGKNSVRHIVMLLAHHQSAEKVLEVLVVFHRHGLIVFQDP